MAHCCKTSTSRRALAALATCLGLAAIPALGQAAFPTGPIKIIVPYPPGGFTNSVVHMLAPMMSRRLGQSVVIENRAGASGNIGTAAVARAAPDGHTLLFTTDVLGKNQHVYKKAGYDATKDFEPVGMVGASPFVLLATSGLAANDVPTLVNMAKAKPGSINYASIGAGSNTHLAAKLFESAAGIQLMHVPYKGGGPAINDVLGGHVQFIFSTVTSAVPLVQGKRAKVLGIAAKNRVAQLPGVPTFAEQGFPGVEMESWLAMLAPAGTPAPVMAKLQDALKSAAMEPEFIKKTADVGFLVNYTGPAEFKGYLRSELARWGDLVKKESIVADE